MLCFGQPAGAQIVKGVLVSASDSQPVPYGTIQAPDGTDRFTDAGGRFSLGDIHDGTYHIHARMLGFAPLDTAVTFGPNRSPLVLRIAPVAIRLSTVPVTAERNRQLTVCTVTGRPKAAASPVLGAIFDQLDVNVERYNLLREKYPFTYRRVETEIIQTTNEDDSVASIDTVAYDSRDRRPYQIGSIVYHDTKGNGQQRTMMYLPTFGDLGDSTFDAAHCFAYMGEKKGEIRIDFRPADRIAAPDVEGSIYLDSEKFLIRRAVFHLTKPKLVSSGVIGLTTTTTFSEALPLVPILQETRTEQPLMSIRSKGVDPRVGGRSPTSFDLHPLLQRLAIETDIVIDHTFIAATVGGEPVKTPAAEPPSRPVTIAIGCTMPPSFETIDIPIYGTIGGAHPGNPNNDRLTLGIRRQFRLPNNLDLPVYGSANEAKATPTLTGQVTFTLVSGRIARLELTATSLLPTVDSALLTAVRRADSLKSFVGVPGGQYTMSLSSSTPDASALAIDLARVSVPVVPIAHKASLDTDAPAPMLPTGKGTFEYVVDEHGRVIPATLRTLKTSSPDFALAVEKGLEKLRYQPAVAGTCPIKQVIQQPFQAMVRVREQ